MGISFGAALQKVYAVCTAPKFKINTLILEVEMVALPGLRVRLLLFGYLTNSNSQ